ncbi:DUF6875 domain-containing protein [Prescottella agglutinans]|uniref:DUF6875 domain-containing protein n=1 Tax=Prescottella agglutinans TaxID=1644129 RepID=UPI003D99CB71
MTAVPLEKLFGTGTGTGTGAGAEHRCSEVLRRWVCDYLTRPHADLGRSGPVCPFTHPSISRGLFWVGFIDGRDVGRQQMTEAVDEVFGAFPELPPVDGDDALLKAVLLVFPDVSDYSLIEEAQREGKSKFVREGLMLGQFYPGCTTPGLRNTAFPALDAPLPILAVRNMVGSDFPFLAQESEWVDAYLKKFANRIPGPVRSSITEMIAGEFATDPSPER